MSTPTHITSPLCAGCKGLCCNSCASANGYHRDNVLQVIGLVPVGLRKREAKRNLKRNAELMTKFFSTMAGSLIKFDPKHGFKTKTGCSLPVHLRSPTCRVYLCHVAGVHKAHKLNGEFKTPTEFFMSDTYRKLQESGGTSISEVSRLLKDRDTDPWQDAGKELVAFLNSKGVPVKW